jgi:hypothetical protein
MNSPELHAAIEAAFLQPVKSMSRTFSPYSSSFTIEELEITFANGETTTMIFKNLASDAMLDASRLVKPSFLYTPEREIQVYRSLLSTQDLGTPKMYGASVDCTMGRYWLLLEKVPAPLLSEIGDFETWLQVARWAARFHSAFDPVAARAAVPALLEYDASYYWRWLERARRSAGSILNRIVGRYDRVVDTLLESPRTLVHGEFYASNILVGKQGSEMRVCPVDWEMAGIGPSLLDVAAVASGKWSRAEQLRILEAYHSALPQPLRSGDLMMAFDCCQLHTALQWLGWSETWSPPQSHAHDWLAEALRISTEESLAPLFD